MNAGVVQAEEAMVKWYEGMCYAMGFAKLLPSEWEHIWEDMDEELRRVMRMYWEPTCITLDRPEEVVRLMNTGRIWVSYKLFMVEERRAAQEQAAQAKARRAAEAARQKVNVMCRRMADRVAKEQRAQAKKAESTARGDERQMAREAAREQKIAEKEQAREARKLAKLAAKVQAQENRLRARLLKEKQKRDQKQAGIITGTAKAGGGSSSCRATKGDREASTASGDTSADGWQDKCKG